MARTIVTDKDSFCGHAFEREMMTELFDLQRAGKYNHTDRIRTLLNLELWRRIFIQRRLIDGIQLLPS